MVDDTSVFSSTSINNEEAMDIYGVSEHCPGIDTQNNSTAITPTDATAPSILCHRSIKIEQSWELLLTTHPSNAAATQKWPQKL